MPTYLRPDVYVEEIPSGSRPIEGVETCVVAFVGPANRGPIDEAVRISTFSEYEDLCGPLTSADDAMGLAVQAFYRNGGKAAYICRVVAVDGATTSASYTIASKLTLEASSPGGWANDLRFRIVKPDLHATVFDLEVGWLNDKQEFEADEVFTSLSLDPADTRYGPNIVDDGSLLLTLGLASGVTPTDAASITGGPIAAADGDGLRASLGAGEKSMSLSVNGSPPKLIKLDIASATNDATDPADAQQAADAAAAALQTTIRDVGDEFSTVNVSAAVASSLAVFKVEKPQTAGSESFSVSVATSGGDLAEAIRIDAGAVSTLEGGDVSAHYDDVYSAIDDASGTTVPFGLTIDGQSAEVRVPLSTLVKSKRADNNDAGDHSDDESNMAAVASAVQKAVRGYDTAVSRFTGFLCSYDSSSHKFKLTAGSATGSDATTVGVAGLTGDLAVAMQLTAGTTSAPGRAVYDSVHQVTPAQLLGTDELGVELAGGEAEDPGSSDYGSYFVDVLRKVRDVTTVLLPGEWWADDGSGNTTIDEARAHCEAMQDRILLVDPPPGHEMTAPLHVEDLGLPTSKFTALYYPWVKVENPEYDADTNPSVSTTTLASPCAFAAGMFSKIDGKRGVWKAPAGVETNLAGVSGLEYNVDNAEQDVLNPLGINCIRKLPGYGNVIWGARTLATKADPEWRYVPVRRTAIFIEDSIRNAIPWAVFEGNDTPLWQSLKANIGGFMDGLHRSGAFQGAKASDAYFVRCGLGETMTQTDIDAGRVIVMVGFAPLKPAEFVIVRVQQIVNMQ